VASDPGREALRADLLALGRPLTRTAAETRLVDGVLSRIASTSPEPPSPKPTAGRPRAGWSAAGWSAALWRVVDAVSRRRRSVAIAVAVVVLSLLGVPAVRAQVAEWFGFDGVQVHVRETPGLAPSRPPTPPPITGTMTLEQATTLVSFQPVVLPALGTPSGVEVSADRRVLSMSWVDGAGRVTRLDQFGARLDYVFAKTAPDVEWVQVGDQTALWFDRPHEVVLLDADGRRRTETARLAGQTLIWERADTVLRLEGGFSLERALSIAGSATPAP
jgi:hypothetical protein